MKSLVLVKQVPDANSVFRINAEGTWIDESNLSFAMNEYDRYALEELLKLKDAGKLEEVVALTVGQKEAGSVLRTCLAMGADRAIHVKHDAPSKVDPLSIARIIVAATRDEGFSLILAGLQADDDNHTQIGGLVAGLLDWPSATAVMALELREGGTLRVERELENNELQVIDLTLPAVLSVQTGINSPRYATLKGIMGAKKKPMTSLSATDLGVEAASGMRSVSLSPPPTGKGAEVLSGSPDEVAAQLVARIRERTGVL